MRYFLRAMIALACLWAVPAWSQAIQYQTTAGQTGTTLVSPSTPLPTTTPLLTNSTASGTITSTQSVVLTPNAGQSAVVIDINGTAWTGTLFVEVAGPSGVYSQTTVVPVLSGSVQTATITVNGLYQANIAGFTTFRIRGNTVATGTATVNLLGTGGIATVMADNPFPVTGYAGMTALSVISVGITPTDHTITSASGSSQQIMAANTTRHSMTIENTGNANCGVNPTGGTAAIGGAGTLTLVPNGAYTPRVPTLSAVTVICTAGQPIYADDN